MKKHIDSTLLVYFSAGLLFLITFLILVALETSVQAKTVVDDTSSSDAITAYRRAAEYSRKHRGLSMVIMKNGHVIFEDYATAHSATEAHNLYSGTKSFSCAIVVAAAQDNVLDIDEPVSNDLVG